MAKGSYAHQIETFDGKLKIVTWNLHYGSKLDQIILTLNDAPDLQNADFILVQEINAAGIERIAKELNYNYVYCPAVHSREHNDDFGDGILSLWPLTDAQAIRLPKWLPVLVEERNAVKANTSIGGIGITVYSIHTDVVWMEPQIEYLANEVSGQNHFTILGGDFNTWKPSSITALENNMASLDLERLSKEASHTFVNFGIPFTLDHIFGSHGFPYSSAVFYDTDASDHYPLWADINLLPME